MQRLSNRIHNEKSHAGPQIQHVDRVIEIPVEVKGEVEVQYVDREVVKEIPVEKVVIQHQNHEAELNQLKEYAQKQQAFNEEAKLIVNRHADGIHQLMQWCNNAKEELEMQRRALVGLKAQRDVDRKRRLSFIKRVKKENDKQRNREFKLKLAVAASLLLTIISLILK